MVSGWKLFGVWFSIGIQSFGGGTTTFTLVRRVSVEQYQWVDDLEFDRDWALCQMAPGINLIALTILIGRRVGGVKGILACVLGLILPSAVLTAALTAGFLSVWDLPQVKGALRGILPASVGLGLVTAFQMAQKPVQLSYRAGWGQLGFSIFLLVGSGALLWSGRVSVVVTLLVTGAVAALEAVIRARRAAS